MIQFFNGAFEAHQDEQGKWFYKANISKIGLKKPPRLSMKERPQYPQIEDIEKSSGEAYHKQNNQMIVDIVKYLNTL